MRSDFTKLYRDHGKSGLGAGRRFGRAVGSTRRRAALAVAGRRRYISASFSRNVRLAVAPVPRRQRPDGAEQEDRTLNLNPRDGAAIHLPYGGLVQGLSR